jgi:hypothetical protein
MSRAFLTRQFENEVFIEQGISQRTEAFQAEQ